MSADEAPPPSAASAGLRRITAPISIAVFVVAVGGIASSAGHGTSPAVLAAASVALVVAAAGTVTVFTWWRRAAGPRVAALVTVGLAGAALAGLLPGTAGFVIVYLALAGLGMRLPPRSASALAAGLVVFAALNVAYLLAAHPSVSGLVSQDIGATFVFAVGAFARSAQIAQAQARIAQARAEDLLAELRASQAAQAEAAALTERARLAREIHDVLAHTLSGLVLALDTMELLGKQGPGLGKQGDAGPGLLERMLEQVTRAQRIARDGLADTKRAVAALRGDALPGPALLDRLVRDTAAATGIRAEFTLAGTERALPPEMGLAIYRTAQEALTNTAKHAGRGARADVRLAYHEDAVDLVIENTRPAGAADTTADLTFGGYGLTGMRERAELLGGSLTAGPTDLGFQVRLQLPAAAATSPAAPAAERGTSPIIPAAERGTPPITPAAGLRS
jgi:signal transduction histidine kinase